jgi:hypothetical protein
MLKISGYFWILAAILHTANTIRAILLHRNIYLTLTAIENSPLMSLLVDIYVIAVYPLYILSIGIALILISKHVAFTQKKKP